MMETLPGDTLADILSRLEAADLGKFARVCKRWNRMTNDERLWERMAVRFNHGSRVPKPEGISWQHFYRQLLVRQVLHALIPLAMLTCSLQCSNFLVIFTAYSKERDKDPEALRIAKGLQQEFKYGRISVFDGTSFLALQLPSLCAQSSPQL